MITSLSNQKIKQIIALRDKPRIRNDSGLFIAEGVRMFEEAPPEQIREICVSQPTWEQMESGNKYPLIWKKLLLCRERDITLEQVSEEVFRKASDTQTPQGILFVMEQAAYSLPEAVARAGRRQRQGGRPALFLVLEDIQDPGNLGTILRTGEGAGVDGVIMNRGTVDIYNPKTIRSTMGSLFRVPFFRVERPEEAIALLRRERIRICAAHLEAERDYDEISYGEGSAFLIGNEGNGLRRETAMEADLLLKIPMEGRLESLNAAVAAALLMYQAAGEYRRSGEFC